MLRSCLQVVVFCLLWIVQIVLSASCSFNLYPVLSHCHSQFLLVILADLSPVIPFGRPNVDHLSHQHCSFSTNLRTFCRRWIHLFRKHDYLPYIGCRRLRYNDFSRCICCCHRCRIVYCNILFIDICINFGTSHDIDCIGHESCGKCLA